MAAWGNRPGQRAGASKREQRTERARQRRYDKELRTLLARMGGERSRGQGVKDWWARFWRALKRTALITALVATVAVAGIWYLNPGLGGIIINAIDGEQFSVPAAGPDGRAISGYPPEGVDAAKEPLGAPPAPVPGAGSYKFVHGTPPVAYDPCRPIHYVTRPDNAPPGGDKLIAAALADASKATGLVFIDDGGTEEAHDANRWSYQPERYGKRWAPVLFVWSTEQEEPKFTRNSAGEFAVAGIGGSQRITGDSGGQVFVSGVVQLNAASLGETLTRDDGAAVVGAVIRHEVGHLLGLDHVQDSTQLMNPTIAAGVTNFADGDLAGLAQPGQGKCFPNH